MLAAEDVVDLVWETCGVFMDEAIFATPTRWPGHLGSLFVADIARHGKGFDGRAPWPFS